MMYRSLLVPLDGSPFGEHALPLALSIARKAGASVQLVHVHIPATSVAIDAVPALNESIEHQNREYEQAYLHELEHKLSVGGEVVVTSKLLATPPVAGALLEHALATRADLVVMTTHGRGAFSRFWLGSVTDTLVRRATTPILLVRPGITAPNFAQPPLCRRILIPLDGSKLSEQMLTHAIPFGSLMEADYTLLQAVEPVISGYGPDAPIIYDQWLGELQRSAEAYLDHLAEGLRAQGLRVKTEVVVGTAAFAILGYAREHAIDLIAMETHGRSGLSRLLLGSVADKVLRGASVPVLLHRPHGEEQWR